jgi:hypothetical protein
MPIFRREGIEHHEQQSQKNDPDNKQGNGFIHRQSPIYTATAYNAS